MSDQYQEFRSAGAEVLAVANATFEQAGRRVRGLKLPFPCMVDPEHTVFDLYQVESEILSMGQRPGLYVIDREGVVKYAQVGWQQWEIPGITEILGICRKLTIA